MLLISVSFVLVTLLSSSAASVNQEIPNENVDPPSSGNVSINNLYIPSPRIIQGFYVKQEMPWIVVLLQNNHPFCTGSLINNQYVLTAAHCVLSRYGKDCGAPLQRTNLYFQAVIGEKNFYNARHGSKHQVVNFWTHPQFNDKCNKWNSDFAVLKLQRPVSNTPVCLRSGSHRNGKLYAIGYGQTDHQPGGGRMSSRLKAVEVYEVPLPQCTRSWGYTITSNKICTKGIKDYSGTCKGDSGGPLAIRDKSSRFIQIGVTSYGSESNWEVCTYSSPDVYARVSSGLSFIRSKAGSIKTC